MIAKMTHTTDIARRCVLICLCAYSSLTAAADWTLSGVGGYGNNVNVVGVEAQVPSDYRGTFTDQWSWALHWASDLSYWWARNHEGSSSSLWEVGLTPVFTLRSAAESSMTYYVEAGIGVHLLSHTQIDGRVLSTAFQFGELVGGGANFGDHGQYAIGIRLQHISNGCIKEPNYGLTVGEVRVSYRF